MRASLLHLLEACDPKDPAYLHLHGDETLSTDANKPVTTRSTLDTIYLARK